MSIRISALSALTAADAGDTIPILDISAGTTKKIQKTQFLSDVIDGSLLAIGAIKANKADFSVADAAARAALSSPFEGLTCYQKDVDATYIYDGSAWRRQAQWEELGRTTLTGAGDTISVTGLAARKYLRIYVTGLHSGSIVPVLRLNNDSATNYAYQYQFSNGVSTAQVSQSAFALQPASAGEAYGFTTRIDIWNSSTNFKVINSRSEDSFGSDATTSINFSEVRGKWASTTQATRVDILNSGAGDFAIGSQVIVEGKD